MKILIDNKDLESYFGIVVLDYTPIFTIAPERKNETEWQDKSGVERLRSNIRYDVNEFALSCAVKETTPLGALRKVKVLTDYMFSKGVFILSLRDGTALGRSAHLCQRSAALVPTVNIRAQNSLFVFKIGLKEVNPNALKFYTDIVSHKASINYLKGQNADIFWGDGSSGEVSNSGIYEKTDYAHDAPAVDVIIDVDASAENVTVLSADFTADIPTGIIPETVTFTDTSIGNIVLWSWLFGDGATSSEQNPIHIYKTPGTYTVSLQIFNSANGSSTKIKTAFVVVRASRILINETDFILINDTNFLLKN